MEKSTTNGTSESTSSYNSADRIKQLNAIDHDINRLLTSAGLAIQALTNAGSLSDSHEHDAHAGNAQQLRKAAFTKHATNYFSLVKSVQVNLRRQVYALEEADIVPSHAAVVSAPAQVLPATAPQRNVGLGVRQAGVAGQAQQKEEVTMPITNGGLGNLDVGWLNSRTADVGKEMEVELWKEARALLEMIERKSNGTAVEEETGKEDDMEVDGIARPPLQEG